MSLFNLTIFRTRAICSPSSLKIISHFDRYLYYKKTCLNNTFRTTSKIFTWLSITYFIDDPWHRFKNFVEVKRKRKIVYVLM